VLLLPEYGKYSLTELNPDFAIKKSAVASKYFAAKLFRIFFYFKKVDNFSTQKIT